MIPTNILRNFRGPRAVDCLNVGLEFAEREMNWPVRARAQMYQVAALAFGPVPNFEEFQVLYDSMVKYWKVNRGGGLATADVVFSMLVEDCAAASRDTVYQFTTDDRDIRPAVKAMRKIKTNGEYPHMAASKFLHFYNPSIFPIYDDAVIWKRVLHGAFRREWATICGEYGIQVFEPSESFLVTYYSFSHEVMKAAGPDVMVEFEQRFRSLGGRDAEALSDLQHYQSAAFEYLLMGAAVTA